MSTQPNSQRRDPRPRQFRDHYYLPTDRIGGGIGLDEIHDRCNNAEQGSRQLREKLETAIFKWAFKHGIEKEQARVLLFDRRMP